MQVRTHARMHTCTQTHVRKHMYTNTCTHMHVYKHMYTHTCIHTCIQTHVHTQVHTHMYTHTRTHTHVHTHMHTLHMHAHTLSMFFRTHSNLADFIITRAVPALPLAFSSSLRALSYSPFSLSSFTAANQMSSLFGFAWKARARMDLAAGTSPLRVWAGCVGWGRKVGSGKWEGKWEGESVCV